MSGDDDGDEKDGVSCIEADDGDHHYFVAKTIDH